MSSAHDASWPPGQDILACYLTEYAKARQLSDLERPWGLGDDGLDALWMRLAEALARDPERLDRLVSEELSEADRLHIAGKLTPLLLAVPLRAYPAELRALRDGPRMMLSVGYFAGANGAVRPPGGAGAGNGAETAPPPHGASRRRLVAKPIGFLPAALISAFTAYLRSVLRFSPDEDAHQVTVSTGGRRRRVRVTILARDRGLVVRFLERLPSAADEGR